MDTSKRYIEMCEKATEIQALIHPKFSFIYSKKAWKDDNGLTVVFWEGGANERYLNGEKLLWLPTQNQLQEMMMLNIPQEETFFELRKLTLGFERKYPESWEQLWLQFVMGVKYGKIWNGKNWEKA